jgi:hypothetical protein
VTVALGAAADSRSQDSAGLLTGDVTLNPRGLAFAVLTGKTKHSARDTKIRWYTPGEVRLGFGGGGVGRLRWPVPIPWPG